ncbi:MAG: RadC family protein [Desulfovibrio sp.]
MSSKPHYHGHRQRLKDKLVKQPQSLADYEILELLLATVIPRSDTKPLAKALMDQFGGLADVFKAPEKQLLEIKGFGPALWTQWVLLTETFARIKESPLREKDVLNDPAIIGEAAIARLGNKAREEFWIALLDNKNRVIIWLKLNEGTVDQAPVYPREIMRHALEHNAAGVILFHNHPGGDPMPSREDAALTQKILKLAEDMDVELIDHFIVTSDSYYNFRHRHSMFLNR